MSSKEHDKAFGTIKTLKTFGTELSYDEDEESQKKKEKNKYVENDIFSINEYIQKANCTLFYIGALPITQKCYICSICNPQEDKYICEFCYYNCHQICRQMKEKKLEQSSQEKTYSIEKDKKGIEEFFCKCGKEYKHMPPNPTINDFAPCDLIKLDKALKLDNFYCDTHKIFICCVCSVQCHKTCKITKTKQVFQPSKTRRKTDKCMCRNECHTHYNEVAFTFPLNEYQKLSGIQIWPIQILNILFNSKRIFHRLSALFTSILNNDIEEITDKDEKKYFSLLTLFSNTFNRKFKTFYYHEDILQIFNYQNLTTYLKQIEHKNAKNITVKFRCIFIFLFIHIRRDFQNIKSLTSIDFLCSSPLERIKYKILLGKQTMFNDNIYTKYNNNKIMEEKNILKEILFDNICTLMEVSIKYINLEKMAYEFEIGIKYICFILKRILLTKNELIYLIHYIKNFFNQFYDDFIKKKPNILLLSNIIQGIIEIVFMIAVSYNDCIIMDYLHKYKDESNIEGIKSIDDFIHVKNKGGSALFQIIIKCCSILKIHYDRLPKRGEKLNNINLNLQIDKDTNIRLPENGGIFPEKIINLYTESLNIFCLADSFYYKQISAITKSDLINYYYFIGKFENNLSYNFNINEKFEIEKLLLELKINIEKKFNSLFTSTYAGYAIEINTKIYQDIHHFSESINSLMTMINNRKGIKNNNINNTNKRDFHLRRMSTTFEMLINQEAILEDKNDSTRTNENEDEDEIKKNIEEKNYWKKLASKKNNIYKFINEMVDNIEIMDEFVDILIISNIDETIGKILTFLSNRKFPNLLTSELCDIIFSTLSLYLYSKNGMKYFLMGKNLSRINKVLNRFNYNSNNKNNNPALGKTIESNIKIMNRTIDFLLDISKGLQIYDLNIKFHKVLPRIKKNLLEHISTFNSVSNNNNLIQFSIHFKKILKIFMNFQNDFKYEDFEDIKIKCIMIFEKNPSKLFDKNTFFKILNSVQSNQVNLNNENNKILLSLYFTFFKFLTINTFYFYNNKEINKILNILLNFNDLNRIKSMFDNNVFTVKQKYILLEYLRTIYFSDYLDEFEILKQTTLLSNSEFEMLLKNNLINTHLLPNNNNNNINNKKDHKNVDNVVISQNTLLNKYKRITEIEIILDIYSNEIKKFPEQLNNCKLKHCELFYRQMLLDVKYISVFFYSQINNIFGKFKILFYGFTLDFLQKIDSFHQIYQKIRQSYKDDNDEISIYDEIINDNDNESNWNVESEKIKEKLNDMRAISFNIYNKKKIYCYLTESIDSLIKISKINLKYNLQNYLEYYDVMAESNFTPFSLLETLDYEYFYDEKAEEENELIKKDQLLFKIESLKNSFINTFIDIHKTNFLEVFTSPSSDNYNYDFRQKYIDYFLSFLNSNEGNELRKLEINLCVFTKMMFYDSDGMQSKFKSINDDDNFFINLNKDINKFSVLVFSLSKNIYAYDMAGEITNLNKLYIQFTQALGEGFNTTFHDKIFHSLKSNNNLQNEINNFNKFIDKYEEEKNECENLNYIGKYSFNGNYNEQSNSSFINKSIYASIINNLNYALYKLDLENLLDSELPNDKLIILVSNCIDFIIEYIDSIDKFNDDIKKCLNYLLLNDKILKTLMKTKSKSNNPEVIIKKNKPYLKLFFSVLKKEETNNDFAIQRKKVICYTKIKITQMLIYYLLTTGKENFVEKLVDKDFTTINLYSEILFNFNDLIKHLEIKNPELISSLNGQKTVDGFTKKLIHFYTYEDNFRNMIELQLIFDIFILIKILEENYNLNRLKILFEKNKSNIDENTFDGNGEFNLGSKFSKGIYKFLNIIILKVEIKMDEENDDNNEEYNNDENEESEENDIPNKKNNEIISKKVRNKLKKDITLNNLINKYKKYMKRENAYNLDDYNQEENEESLSMSLNADESSISSEDEDSEEKSNKKTIFFPRPFLTFFLSKNTQNKFINNVDVTGFSKKSILLLNYADYCLFEMIVNKHIIGHSRFNKMCINLNYTYIEMINYLIIIIQNFLILFRFYKKTDESYEEYYSFDKSKIRKLYHENMILAIVQMIFIGVFIVIWYLYKFLNSCQNKIMSEYNKPFVGQRLNEERKISQVVVDYFQDKPISNTKFFNDVNKDLTFWEKFYIIVISTHLINREIVILFLSLILDILFIATKMPIFLVVQILFILNIISTLFDIVLAIQMKWKNIILLLLFDFLCIYIFAWFAFFYFSYFFVFDEVMIPQSQETLTEGFCFSSVQCYLFMLNRGSLSNGGISNDLGLISYKRNVSHYIGRFFFDVIFFLIISLYISKMFLSFIIDTFGELRQKNSEAQEEKNNVCFICEIKRDKCLLKNIDFDKHVEQEHNIWNYVYFLNYLYVNNSLNFNWIENSVWEKLKKQGSNWLPLVENED